MQVAQSFEVTEKNIKNLERNITVLNAYLYAHAMDGSTILRWVLHPAGPDP